MHDDNTPLADDLIWGGKGISIEIFGNDAPKYVRKTFYLLERGLIDAEKIGDQWVGSRQRLRSRFHNGQVAQAIRRPQAGVRAKKENDPARGRWGQVDMSIPGATIIL